ncbi:MAG: peptide MFS transporter [Elusimicrobiota bacterium]|jgi:POT family proton-dependent oligopeptide transporter|nr:peptide MFS transporter [Elusimicrobiota bacterium]
MNDNAVLRNEQLMKKSHPKGLYMLFMVEMWERFNFYGMRGLLTLFMASAVIGFSDQHAMKIYSWFLALVYLTPVAGGWLADNYIGKRHSITIGAILMAIGQFTLAAYGLLPAKVALFAGLAFIIIGNGFFKPTISSIVGDLYEPNDPRRDGGFTIFYMGINVGAFIAPFVTGFFGEQTATSPAWVQWRWGFMSAGIGMLIGLIWYLTQQKKYLGDIGLHPVSKKSTDVKIAQEAKRPLTTEEKQRILAIFVFTFFAVFFFCFFEQAGSSLTIIARDNINRMFTIFGKTLEVRVSWLQAANPIFVVLLAPLFSKLWVSLSERKKEPSTPVKFAWGLFLLGVGYLIIAWGAYYVTGGKISIMWLLSMYFLHTAGELCLSPVGLSLMTKLSPAKYVSMFIGVWFLGTTIGNKLSGNFAELIDKMSLVSFLLMPAVCTIAFAGIVLLFAKKIKYWMHGIQ